LISPRPSITLYFTVDSRPIYLVYQGKRHDEYLPYGLLYVGKALSDAGFRVRVFHLRGDDDNGLEEAVRHERPLFVGFSNFISPLRLGFTELPHLLKLDVERSRRLREQGIKVVWGGILTTSLPNTVLESGCADYIVAGEGERPVVPLARAIAEGSAPEGVPGVGYVRDGEPVVEPPLPPEPDLDRFSFGMDMVDWTPYLVPSLDKRKLTAYIPFSRGCPNRCSFCYNSMREDRWAWRAHSPEFMRELVGFLRKRYGVNQVFLGCDNPFADPDQARKILEAMDIDWLSPAPVKVIDREFAEWAADNRCMRLGFGLESGSDRVLKLMNKGITTDMVREKLAICNEKGLYTVSAWMGFVPGETMEELRTTFTFMDELYEKYPRHGMRWSQFRAYPRTPFWDKSVEMGLYAPKDLDEWTRYDGTINRFMGVSDRRANRLYVLANSLYLKQRSLKGVANPALRSFMKRRLGRARVAGPFEEAFLAALEARRRIRRN